MKKIVKEGWEDKATGAESPEELLKNSIFALRRDISATHHQFEEEDGSIREPDSNVVGDSKQVKERWAQMVEDCRQQKTLLADALVHVEYEVLPKLEKPTVEYLNQIGGAYNYVANQLLERTADTVSSEKELDSILHNFMPLFFHVSGWERFGKKVQDRLGKEEAPPQKQPDKKRGPLSWFRKRE